MTDHDDNKTARHMVKATGGAAGRGVSSTGEETGNRAFASPPCFMHEVDPSYFGYMTVDEMLALLNRLLEGERAGARGVGELSKEVVGPGSRATLRNIAADEARFCAMLSRHIKRLGGTPSRRTGAFYEKLRDSKTLSARFNLLDRGQEWVVRKLRETLPRIHDELLHADLREMLVVHQHNIERCGGLGGDRAVASGRGGHE